MRNDMVKAILMGAAGKMGEELPASSLVQKELNWLGPWSGRIIL